MNHCKTCKHWIRRVLQQDLAPVTRVEWAFSCGRAAPFIRMMDGRELVPLSVVFTEADFGCVLHEGKHE